MTNSSPQTAVVYQHIFEKQQAQAVAQKWQLPFAGDIAALKQQNLYQFLLLQTANELSLIKVDEPKLAGVFVDFIGGAVGHRRKFGGGRGQEIAKAVGLKHGFTPKVLDATAGLGRDAFILANLGCHVVMTERNTVVAALLDDGLQRAMKDAEIGEWINKRMQLKVGASHELMASLVNDNIDVVYLDPMYPHKEKSALVKKEMRIFQSLVGADLDADALLEEALAIAKYRVVVKRPSYAEPLANKKPSTSIAMKNNRFDVYVNAAIPKLV